MSIDFSRDLLLRQGTMTPSQASEVEMTALGNSRQKIDHISTIATYRGAQEKAEGGRFFRNVIEWIHTDRPRYQQALIYTAAIAVTILLCASVIGLLVVVPATIQLAAESDKKELRDRISDADNQVFAAIGGKEKYMKLPKLYGRFNIDDGIRIITPGEMEDSLMRAEDVRNRPMLLMKIRNSIGEVFVQAIYRRFTHQPEWSFGYGERTLPFSGEYLNDSDLTMIRALATEKSYQGYHRV